MASGKLEKVGGILFNPDAITHVKAQSNGDLTVFFTGDSHTFTGADAAAVLELLDPAPKHVEKAHATHATHKKAE